MADPGDGGSKGNVDTMGSIERIATGSASHPWRVLVANALVVALGGAANPAHAQPEADLPRVQLHVGAGIDAAASDFGNGFLFDHALFGPEMGRVQSEYEPAAGAGFEFGGHGRVWRNLALGATLAGGVSETDAAVSGELPHPFHFDRPRSIDGTVTGLEWVNSALHVQVLLMIPVSPSFTVTVFGGPSWFDVSQDLVTEIRFDQSYPYDAATWAGADRSEAAAQAWGAHAGVDAAYYFTRRVGVGGAFRFSRGEVQLAAPRSDDSDVIVGGAQASGGLRLRF